MVSKTVCRKRSPLLGEIEPRKREALPPSTHQIIRWFDEIIGSYSSTRRSRRQKKSLCGSHSSGVSSAGLLPHPLPGTRPVSLVILIVALLTCPGFFEYPFLCEFVLNSIELHCCRIDSLCPLRHRIPSILRGSCVSETFRLELPSRPQLLRSQILCFRPSPVLTLELCPTAFPQTFWYQLPSLAPWISHYANPLF